MMGELHSTKAFNHFACVLLQIQITENRQSKKDTNLLVVYLLVQTYLYVGGNN